MESFIETQSNEEQLNELLDLLEQHIQSCPSNYELVCRRMASIVEKVEKSSIDCFIANGVPKSPEVPVRRTYKTLKETEQHYFSYLNQLAGRKLSLCELLTVAMMTGRKHGLYVNHQEKRTKAGILKWLREHHAILEKDIAVVLKDRLQFKSELHETD